VCFYMWRHQASDIPWTAVWLKQNEGVKAGLSDEEAMVRLGDGEVGGGGAEDRGGFAVVQMSPARLSNTINDVLGSGSLTYIRDLGPIYVSISKWKCNGSTLADVIERISRFRASLPPTATRNHSTPASKYDLPARR